MPTEEQGTLLRRRLPSEEARWMMNHAFQVALTSVLVYFRTILSMNSLGHGLEQPRGSINAIAFVHTTGYSILSSMASGMKPLCSQAFGAQRPNVLCVTLHRYVVFLLTSAIPISLVWLLIDIPSLSRSYLLFSLPDLFTYSLLHPISIYLCAQGIAHPLTAASLVGALFHLTLNYLFVSLMQWGVAGVAAAASTSNLIALVALVLYVWKSGLHKQTWTPPTWECLKGWKKLVRSAALSCLWVCLEWCWHGILILLCGAFADPKASVASMGILRRATSFLYVFPSSLGSAVSTRVGNELGANRPGKARASAGLSMLLALAMGTVSMAFAVGMRHTWARMFTSDEDILRLTSAALPIIGLSELGNCLQTVGRGVVQGTARSGTAPIVNMSGLYLVGLPVAVGLGFRLGFSGLFIGLLSAKVFCAGMMLYVVGSIDWTLESQKASKTEYNN